VAPPQAVLCGQGLIVEVGGESEVLLCFFRLFAALPLLPVPFHSSLQQAHFATC